MERATVTDVGFLPDINFVFEWKREKGFKIESPEQFTLSILQIFQNFLEFCCTQIFDQGGVIINTKDGEILETQKFLSGEFKSQLSKEEISVLKTFQENSDNDEKGKYCVDFTKWYWYMINPLITNWRFSVPTRKQECAVIKSTRITNGRFKNVLKLMETEGADKALEICGASLCEILKVDKEVPAIDPIPSRPSVKRRRLDSYQSSEDQDHDGHEYLDKDTEECRPPKKKIKKESAPNSVLVTFDLESSPPPDMDEKSLAYQLYILLEECVVIPDEQFDDVLEAVNFLQKVFFHNNDPTSKVSLFRNWNLKLKRLHDDPGHMAFVYVYNRKPCEETESGFTMLPSGKIWKILKSREVKKKINVLEGPTPKGKDPSTFEKGWTLECKGFGGSAQEDEGKLKLCLFSSHKFLFEVEICGLLGYMCKFDGRAYQMIKMAYLWMGLNELTIEEVGDEGNGCGWSSLQWLVIFWMCHRKMVPSPKEIQGRGSHKVMRDGGTGVDLGWEEDKDFLEEWKEGKEDKGFSWSEDCVISLLERFREFLEFCGWLGEGSGGNWILNTRNGELIDMKKFMNSVSGEWDKTMSTEEINLLKAQVLNYQNCKIYLSHPLNMGWKFGLRYDIGYLLKLMKTGGIRLKKYLNKRKSNGEKAVKKRFKSLRNVDDAIAQ